MMKLSRFGTMGWLAVVLGLVTACEGQLRNLGDNTGGTTSGSTGGANGATGGADGLTGGSHSTPASTGGSGGAGGQTSYVWNPTLPIDPTCTCDSSDKICNAASECVPRCDDSGRCAKWLASQPVVDMIVEGTTLYFAEQATTDPVGNPANNGALYRVNPTDSAPTLIAGHLGNPFKILGRYQGATYIQTLTTTSGSVMKVTDSGNTNIIDTIGYQASMWGHWLAYTNVGDSQLMGVDLDAAQQPILLAAPPADSSGNAPVFGTLVMQDQVLFVPSASNQICSVQLSNPTAGASCGDFYGSVNEVTTSGTQYYTSGDMFQVRAYAPLNKQLLTLYNDGNGQTGFRCFKIVYNDGWIYVDLISDQQDNTSRLVRVPTTVGRLPQDVLPEAIVTRNNSSTQGGSTTTDMIFAIGPSDVYWVQYLPPEIANQPQYIFSAPLPPKPCDAELPCADSTQVCTNGLCGSAQ